MRPKHDTQTRRSRGPGLCAGLGLSLTLSITGIAGCAVSEPISPREEARAAEMRVAPDGAEVTLRQARSLALREPPEQAIKQLERAVFAFPLNEESLRRLTEGSIHPKVRAYLTRRFRKAPESPVPGRLEREPLTPRLNRFAPPENRPGAPYYDPSPQGP